MSGNVTGKDEARKSEIINISVITLAVFILTFFICPFSPLYRYVFSYDEVCYKMIIKGMTKGLLPYKDLFDHKGPLTYVILFIGYILAGKHDIGIWILSAVIDSLGFVFLYKISGLKLTKEGALLSTILLMGISSVFVTDVNILASGAKPDNFIFTALCISGYLFLKGTMFSKKGTYIIPLRSLYIIGVLCGLVFMIKLNVCFFYLAFVGCYFLWLIIKKKSAPFFKSSGIFLAGIATITLPVLTVMEINGSFGAFVDDYISFNLSYGSGFGGIYLMSGSVSMAGKISITVFLILCVLALLKDVMRNRIGYQKIVMFILGIITFLALTYSVTNTYVYVIFLILFLYGTNTASESITEILSSKKTVFPLSVILAALFLASVIAVSFINPFIPSEKQDYETKIEEYGKTHPDARYLFLGALTQPIYDAALPGGPSGRMFYTPNKFKSEMFDEQLQYVKNQVPDVVVFAFLPETGEDGLAEGEDAVNTFLMNNNYTLYVKYPSPDGNYLVNMYVRN